MSNLGAIGVIGYLSFMCGIFGEVPLFAILGGILMLGSIIHFLIVEESREDDE
jgi:hypothetical protein